MGRIRLLTVIRFAGSVIHANHRGVIFDMKIIANVYFSWLMVLSVCPLAVWCWIFNNKLFRLHRLILIFFTI